MGAISGLKVDQKGRFAYYNWIAMSGYADAFCRYWPFTDEDWVGLIRFSSAAFESTGNVEAINFTPVAVVGRNISRQHAHDGARRITTHGPPVSVGSRQFGSFIYSCSGAVLEIRKSFPGIADPMILRYTRIGFGEDLPE